MASSRDDGTPKVKVKRLTRSGNYRRCSVHMTAQLEEMELDEYLARNADAQKRDELKAAKKALARIKLAVDGSCGWLLVVTHWRLAIALLRKLK